MWDDNIKYLRSLGFKVDEFKHDKDKYLKFQRIIEGKAVKGEDQVGAKSLHGVYYWGHGGDGGLWARESPGQPDLAYGPIKDTKDGKEVELKIPTVSLQYKLAFATVFACDSEGAKAALSSAPAPNHIWFGKTGLLVPLGNFHLNKWIVPGQQSTQKP